MVNAALKGKKAGPQQALFRTVQSSSSQMSVQMATSTSRPSSCRPSESPSGRVSFWAPLRSTFKKAVKATKQGRRNAFVVKDMVHVNRMRAMVVQRRMLKLPRAHRYLTAWNGFSEGLSNIMGSLVKGPLQRDFLDSLMKEYIDALFLDSEASRIEQGLLVTVTLRRPHPVEFACWAALHAIAAGKLQVAMAVLIIFGFVLRPSKASMEECMDLVPHPWSSAIWSQIGHPFMLQLPSRTGAFGEPIMLKVGSFNFIVKTAARMIRAKAISHFQLLLRTTATEVNSFLKEIVPLHPLERLEVVSAPKRLEEALALL